MPAGTGAVASTVENKVLELKSVFDFMTPNQISAAKSGLGVTDLTLPCQAAIDSGYSLEWGDSSCVFGVSKLTFDQNGKTYKFNGAAILALATTAQDCLIDWKAGYCTSYGAAFVLNYKNNYASTIHWHSASAGLPAQANKFFGMSIDNAIYGILFGEFSPTVVVDAAQSENYIFGFRTRGVQNPLYCNQPNGFIKFIGGNLACGKNEWDINNPGVYSYTNSCVVTLLQGVVNIANADVQKTDTQLGYGLVNSGGILAISGSNPEIACQVLNLSGGYTSVYDTSGGYWGNATHSWCVLSGSTGGVLHVDGFVLNKAAAAATADTAFIDLGGASNWDVSLGNLYLENQLNLIFNNGNTQAGMWADNDVHFINCQSVATSGAASTPYFGRVSSATENLLDLRGTDTIGNDISTWYKRDLVGTGTLSLVADVPTSSNYFACVEMAPQLAGLGTSSAYSIDLTSLATVKSTAIKCKPGDTFKLSGWFKMTTAGSGAVEVLWAGTTGTAVASEAVADQSNLLTTTWKYINTLFVVPATGAYMGVGITGTSGTVVRMVGLTVQRLD